MGKQVNGVRNRGAGDSIGVRVALGLFVAALAVRLALVLWAPAAPTADGFFYHQYARLLLDGRGYVNLDGSPAIRWMPGWPLFLAGVYAVFGVHPRAAMGVNAVLGAATSVLVAVLAARLLGRAIGRTAGVLYSAWPGLIYLTATLYTETFFNFLLCATLVLLAGVALPQRRAQGSLLMVGALLGLCTLVRAETPGLLAVVVLFLWTVRPSWSVFARWTAITVLAAAVVLAPWSLRNHRVFGRFIPGSANGGIVAYLGHHPGARGGNDLPAALAYARAHRRPTVAESLLARNSAGWRDAWTFARAHPIEEMRLVARKLLLTYGNDADGATLLRGVGGPARWRLSAAAYRRLVVTANVFWFGILALAGAGLFTVSSWPPAARVLLLGPILVWMMLHVLFIGASRFHVPESPMLAILAACGLAAARQVARPARMGQRGSDQ